MNKKSFLNIILVIAIILFVGKVGYSVFVGESDLDIQQADQVQEISGSEDVSTQTQVSATAEQASGIVKSVYSKSGKNFIDIDYVELNSNWTPGDVDNSAYQNNNQKIRTFEISSNAKFIVGSPAVDSVTFSEFQNFFSPSNTSYQKLNPWDIVIDNGVITEVKEHFIP